MRRLRTAWIAALLAAGAGAQEPEAEPVAVRLWCGPAAVPWPWARGALDPLLAEPCQGLAWEWAAQPAAADVWIAAPLAELWAAAEGDRLAARGTWEGVDAGMVEPGGRFAVRFSEPWVLAWGEGAFAEPPAAVEDLLWQSRFDQKVALPVAGTAPELWDGWHQTLAALYGEAKAQAWLTRLDGRISAYADDVARSLEALRAGGVGLLPRGHAAHAPGLAWAAPSDGAPRRSLGVALMAGARPNAAALLARLLVVEAEIAQALELAPIEPGAFTLREELAPTQRQAIERWWSTQVRGRGAGLEALDRWLDVVLGVVLAAVLFGIYRSIRRGEAK